ncbi:uncharacterized protein DUF983 [Sphingobacterium allocomposti]|uniref:Uncharacterized protein DUF983 n=1 Tax=Sphingobacterium allocomposti TaxID=415956 RepID=A0A5S5DRH9_9SPHI|nr:DUF983 domain-containing protein [Sphingobacterium composti Yoo et al. 2007 non Ten et al. 2007]TYP98365.1 uncharacterized protein DUF983 [Sphingobacterium composti Yoo et al. 2007 non Ten et al. 2007]
MENNATNKTESAAPGEFKSAVDGKCPRCRTGNMFEGPLLSFKSKKMYTHCPHCGLKFEKEPGYFYVAMYVSYVFVVAELVTACVATYILTRNMESPWLYLTVAITAAVVMAPFNYRYSRVVLMYWLTPQFRYRPDLYGKPKK